jgi:regulator of cell morphogenesis and NO signaling
MKITSKSVVGDIVADNYKTAEIFKKHNIDFCCGGQQTIEEACDKEHLSSADSETLLQSVNAFFEQNEREQHASDYRNWPLDELADHVETKHHGYVEAKIPVIKEYLDKIESAHGKKHPELSKINTIFKDATGQLVMHMKKEELILFPYIRKMAKAKRKNIQLATPTFETIKNPISKMDEEHDFEGEAFREIAALANNYNVPADGCNTYRVAFGMLKEFDEDLHLHIHKENNVLFQRAIALEEELLQA